MSARRGRKDPSLLIPVKAEQEDSSTVIVAGRPLRYGKYTLPAGTEVPGAEAWPRLEAWISARHVKRIGADSEYVRFADFAAEQDALEEQAATEIVELDSGAQDEPEKAPEPQE